MPASAWRRIVPLARIGSQGGLPIGLLISLHIAFRRRGSARLLHVPKQLCQRYEQTYRHPPWRPQSARVADTGLHATWHRAIAPCLLKGPMEPNL